MVCASIRENCARRILVQLPEGLKRRAREICEIIERGTDASVILQGESTYGACDPGHGFERLGVDAVVHLGHARIPELVRPVEGCSKQDDRAGCRPVQGVLVRDGPEVPFYFLEVPMEPDTGNLAAVIFEFLEKEHLRPGRFGLLAAVQYVHSLVDIAGALERKGVSVTIGKGDRRLAYHGQVLGCNFSAAGGAAAGMEREKTERETKRANEDLIFIGSGNFHPLGLALSTGLPVIAADPNTCETRRVDTERFLRQRHAAITTARYATTFAVLISNKAGQHREMLAESLHGMLREHGKVAFMVTMDHIDPGALRYLDVEVLVSTACPRLAIDDYGRFRDAGKTIITPQELEIALGLREWENYEMDEIREGQDGVSRSCQLPVSEECCKRR